MRKFPPNPTEDEEIVLQLKDDVICDNYGAIIICIQYIPIPPTNSTCKQLKWEKELAIHGSFFMRSQYDCGVVITNTKFDLNLTEVGQQSVTGTYQFRWSNIWPHAASDWR